MFKRLFLALALACSLATAMAWAQVSVPNTFVPGTTIQSSKINANFGVLADALNRTGGTITGNIAVNPGITIDGVDISVAVANTAKTNEANTFTLAQNFGSDVTVGGTLTSNGSLAVNGSSLISSATTNMLQSTQPVLYLKDTDQPGDYRNFLLLSQSGSLSLSSTTDAGAGVDTFFTANRTVPSLTFPTATVASGSFAATQTGGNTTYGSIQVGPNVNVSSGVMAGALGFPGLGILHGAIGYVPVTGAGNSYFGFYFSGGASAPASMGAAKVSITDAGVLTAGSLVSTGAVTAQGDMKVSGTCTATLSGDNAVVTANGCGVLRITPAGFTLSTINTGAQGRVLYLVMNGTCPGITGTGNIVPASAVLASGRMVTLVYDNGYWHQ